MHPNFCSECGSRLSRKGWRLWMAGGLCDNCVRRIGSRRRRTLIIVASIALASFAFGRYLRPSPPPLIIQRMANSPLSDLPVNVNESATAANRKQNGSLNATRDPQDDAVYICGARTKKGTACRRRVHFAGERCFQHKGMPAMVPIEKLTIKDTVANRR
jgi:hypothetical protein